MMMVRTATTQNRFVLLIAALLLQLLLLERAAARGGSCACEAEEFGFSLNCNDTQAMIDALGVLRSEGCSSDCSSVECEKNYYIVQAHHDSCPQEGIPEEIEDGFHDFDQSCIA